VTVASRCEVYQRGVAAGSHSEDRPLAPRPLEFCPASEHQFDSFYKLFTSTMTNWFLASGMIALALCFDPLRAVRCTSGWG
jgi:hypothetical protein